jgi:sensor histidine kinase YesM
MGPRLRFTLDLPQALREAPVPPLLLQPLVENAIRHGLEPQVSGGLIAVSARLEQSAEASPTTQSQLVLEVHDTGVGLDTARHPSHSTAGTHFGLEQVRERLATLYGSAGTLELIAASAGGTCAVVRFPFQPAQP